jgi:hypothetical protein
MFFASFILSNRNSFSRGMSDIKPVSLARLSTIAAHALGADAEKLSKSGRTSMRAQTSNRSAT